MTSSRLYVVERWCRKTRDLFGTSNVRFYAIDPVSIQAIDLVFVQAIDPVGYVRLLAAEQRDAAASAKNAQNYPSLKR